MMAAGRLSRTQENTMTIDDPGLWRLWLFLALLAALSLLERLRPGPNPPQRRAQRWPAHLALVALDTLLARLLLPAGAFGAALWAQSAGFGVFNAASVHLPIWLEATLSVLLMDLAIYWQHRWLHALPWLWPMHRVHHTDTTLDASSALRFHPLEILLSLAYKCALAIALGIDPAVLLMFEALLSSFALITHANLSLPPRLDTALRWVLVTPAMHWIHHSTHRDEQQRNFGFHLSVWDRLFGSYAQHARDRSQRFGVEGVGIARATGIVDLLREPLRTAPPPSVGDSDAT
jgi:sterol desaturase/sphingolipid hydroxylase (fatty acid hydroxylase superfamily)